MHGKGGADSKGNVGVLVEGDLIVAVYCKNGDCLRGVWDYRRRCGLHCIA